MQFDPKRMLRAMARFSRAGALLPLDQTFRLYGETDKWVHGYSRPYRRHIGHLRRDVNHILEIGVGGYENALKGGGSLRVWRDCFPRSTVVGLDLAVKSVQLGDRVTIVQGDQANESDLEHAVETLGGPPNIVIDDGSHFAGHAIASFRYLFPRMPLGAVYIIEDLQTSYSENWGGSIPPSEDTAIGHIRDLVDAVQVQDPSFDRRPQDGPKPTHWASGVGSMHLYPGIVFIEKL